MSMLSGRIRVGLATLLMAGCALGAQAQPTTPEGSGWRFQMTPYLWMIKLNANIKHGLPGVPSISIDRSRSDILKDLNAAVFLNFTARKGQWVFMGDYLYASLSERNSLPYGLRAKTRLRQQKLTALGGVHLATGATHGVDVLAGVRHWDARTRIEVSPLGLQRSFSKSYFEPVLALRGRVGFGQDQRWSLIGYADAGGVGRRSRNSHQFFGALNYAITPNQHLSLGYRYLKLKYQVGAQKLNADFSGPVLGYTVRF